MFLFKKPWIALALALALTGATVGGAVMMTTTSTPAAASDAFLPLGTPYTPNPDCTYSHIQVGSQWMLLEQCNH